MHLAEERRQTDSLTARTEIEKRETDLQKRTKTLDKYLTDTTINVGDAFYKEIESYLSELTLADYGENGGTIECKVSS
jgi:hypothetical protein